MNESIKSRTTRVLALSLGQTLTTIASIVSGMVAARILSKHDYATMKQTMLAFNFIAPILMLGLPNALIYFLPREKEKKGVVFNNLFILFALSLIFSIFLMSGGYKILALRFNNPDLNTTLKWMIPYPLYFIPLSILGPVLLTQNKVITLSIYNVVSTFLLTTLTILSTILIRNYTGPLIVQIYFPILLLPVVLYLSFKDMPGKVRRPRWPQVSEMIKYAVPLGLAGMLGMIMLETNKFVVSALCTPEEFANYINGAIEIPFIGVITGSMSSIILVDMTNYINEGKSLKALELFKIAAIKSASILFPIMIFLLIAGKPFIITLYSEKYLESVIPFYIYLFIIPIRIVVYGSALMSLGQSKVILMRSIFDLLINTILSIILVHFIGYLGAAMATIITLYFWTVPYNLLKIGKGFAVNPLQTLPFRDLGKTLALCLPAAPLSLLYNVFKDFPSYLQLGLAFILYFPITFYLLYKFKLIIIPEKLRKFIPTIIYENATNISKT